MWRTVMGGVCLAVCVLSALATSGSAGAVPYANDPNCVLEQVPAPKVRSEYSPVPNMDVLSDGDSVAVGSPEYWLNQGWDLFQVDDDSYYRCRIDR